MHLEKLNDNYLASVNEKGIVQVWDINRGDSKYTFNLSSGLLPNTLYSPMLSLKNDLFATSLTEYKINDNFDFENKYFIKIWDLKTGELKFTFDEKNGGHLDKIQCMSLLENGFLASADISGVIKVWDIEKKEIKYTFNTTESILSLISLDHNYLAAGYLSGITRVFNIEIGKLKYSLDGSSLIPGTIFNSNVNDMALLENGYLAVASSGGFIKIWDMINGKLKFFLDQNNNQLPVLVLAELQNGYMASGDSQGIVKIWDITNGKLVSTLIGHSSSITNLVELDNGRLASSDTDGTIKIWNPYEVKLLFTFDSSNGGSGDLISELYALENDILVSASSIIQIWDVNS